MARRRVAEDRLAEARRLRELDIAANPGIEDAGLNASAPPQQRWIDGWLVRFSPAKAKRARCVNAVADGRLTLDERLAACERVFAGASLPLIVRVTPFSAPTGLDGALEAHRLRRFDDTRVMVLSQLPGPAPAMPTGLSLHRLEPTAFAERVGCFRGSPIAQRISSNSFTARSWSSITRHSILPSSITNWRWPDCPR